MSSSSNTTRSVRVDPLVGPPSLPGRVLLAFLTAYKRWLSPLLPRACRFTPTCSEYARLAILEYGAVRGTWLACGRILRCQPFHPGGVDLP